MKRRFNLKLILKVLKIKIITKIRKLKIITKKNQA